MQTAGPPHPRIPIRGLKILFSIQGCLNCRYKTWGYKGHTVFTEKNPHISGLTQFKPCCLKVSSYNLFLSFSKVSWKTNHWSHNYQKYNATGGKTNILQVQYKRKQWSKEISVVTEQELLSIQSCPFSGAAPESRVLPPSRSSLVTVASHKSTVLK